MQRLQKLSLFVPRQQGEEPISKLDKAGRKSFMMVYLQRSLQAECQQSKHNK